MATYTYKVLAQSAPTNTSLTDIYTVGASTSAAATALTICNQTGTAATFRVSVAVAGAADVAKQYLFYDASCPANSTITVEVGLTLATTDVLRVKTNTANALSFNLFGTEIT